MDMVTFGTVLLVLAIVTLIGFKMFNSLDDGFANVNNSHVDAVFDNTAGVWTLFDYAMIFVLVTTALTLFVSAFFIRSNPFFFILSFLGMGITVLISVLYSNIYTTIIGKDAFITETGGLPITSYLFTYFPYFMIVIGIVFMIIFHAKTRGQGMEI